MSSTEQLSGVLWDMDGTLINSRGLWEAAYHDLAHREGKRPVPGLWDRVAGRTLEDSVALLYTHVGLDTDRGAVNRGSSWLVAHVCELVEDKPALLEWRPGAKEALQAVRHAGIPTALVTTTWRALTDRIIATLQTQFGVSVCGDEVAHGKPAPDPYLRAIDLLAAHPSGCVAVEDSPSGVAAAERAGIAVLAVPSHTRISPGKRRQVRSSLQGLTVTELGALLST